MFPALLEKLQKNIVPATNTDISNIIDPEAVASLSNTTFSNTMLLEVAVSLMAKSSNSLVKIIYNIIQENPYAIFLFVVISVFILTIFLRLFIYIFTQKPKSMKKHLGRRILHTFLSSRFIFTGLLLGVIVGVDVLAIPKPVAHFIKVSIFSILLWTFYVITNKIISIYTRAILIAHKPGSKMKFFKNKNAFIVISRGIHAAWFLFFITILLGLWGVELGPILAGLGIVGVVVGLALQDSLSHLVGGISLMLDETYSEGDYVILDNKDEGIIFQIGYRSTKLRTFDEEIIAIPNGVLSKMIITNLSQPVKRSRVNLFYKTYMEDTDVESVKELLLHAVTITPSTLTYPAPYVFFIEPKGNFYSFRLSFYTKSPMNKMSTTDAVQQEVVKLFATHHIRFGIDENIVHLKEK